MSALKAFGVVSQRFSAAQIANAIGLHSNTVQRWEETGNVPEIYKGDFLRMIGQQPDHTIDQFYTKPSVAKQCYETFKRVAASLGIDRRKYHYIEPSCGCGWFYNELPKTRRVGIDLEPVRLDGEKIVESDYLQWQPRAGKKYIVIGNPPFGLRGHLALQFINHSAGFADVVAFILPQLFESDGKGSPMKRVDKRFRLAHSERLPADSFERPDGEPVSVGTIYQVWTKVNHDKITLPPRKTCKSFVRIYSMSDGGTPASTRNRAMIGKCDLYLPSTCFSAMGAYRRFEDLPNQRGYGIKILRGDGLLDMLASHDWESTAFRSTNGALNLRTSLIEDVIANGGYFDDQID